MSDRFMARFFWSMIILLILSILAIIIGIIGQIVTTGHVSTW